MQLDATYYETLTIKIKNICSDFSKKIIVTIFCQYINHQFIFPYLIISCNFCIKIFRNLFITSVSVVLPKCLMNDKLKTRLLRKLQSFIIFDSELVYRKLSVSLQVKFFFFFKIFRLQHLFMSVNDEY